MATEQSNPRKPEHLALLREIAGLDTQFDIFQFFKRLVATFGQKGFLVLRMPASTHLELGVSSIITNFPCELVAAYDKAKLMKDSPAYYQTAKSTVPFTFEIDEIYKGDNDQRMKSAREMFRRAGLVRGGVFPVSNAVGERGAIILSGDRPLLDPEEMLVLTMVSTHVFDRLFQIRLADDKSGASLTRREIDCLAWTSAGKTSAEIADILGLSEHTVNHYLNRAARKLDSVNRTQAVAKALRAGIIR